MEYNVLKCYLAICTFENRFMHCHEKARVSNLRIESLWLHIWYLEMEVGMLGLDREKKS